jgi:hypothetical protein
MFESSSRSDSLKGLFARSKLKVCTLMRSAYCTSIIAPRRRRDASDNIERMAIAMSGCLPSGQVVPRPQTFRIRERVRFWVLPTTAGDPRWRAPAMDC